MAILKHSTSKNERPAINRSLVPFRAARELSGADSVSQDELAAVAVALELILPDTKSRNAPKMPFSYSPNIKRGQ